MKMNPEVKARWVAALQSGKYKQAKGVLRQIDEAGNTLGFCCLGVLCNLHAESHPAVAAGQTNPRRYLGVEGVLPIAVMAWAGLPLVHGADLKINGRIILPTDHNDDGRTFAEIAAAIQAQL